MDDDDDNSPFEPMWASGAWGGNVAPEPVPVARIEPRVSNDIPSGVRQIPGNAWFAAVAEFETGLRLDLGHLNEDFRRIATKHLGDLSAYREGDVQALWFEAKKVWTRRRQQITEPRNPANGGPSIPHAYYRMPRSEMRPLPPIAKLMVPVLGLSGMGAAEEICGPDPGPESDGYEAWLSCRETSSVQTKLGPYVLLSYLLSLTGGAVGAYHGYKRHKGSIPWAIGWSIFGGLLPILALPVAFAQGIGKEKKKAA